MQDEIKEQESVSTTELSTLIGGMLMGPMWAEFHKLIPVNRAIFITLLSPLEPQISEQQIEEIINTVMSEMAADFIDMAFNITQVVSNQLMEKCGGKPTLQ